jgi:DNA excision repair protein ERCC-5
MDPDLREHRRKEALSALAKRYPPRTLAPLTTKPGNQVKTRALLLHNDEDRTEEEAPVLEDEDDEQLAVAIEYSLQHKEEHDLREAIEASRVDVISYSAQFSIEGSNIGASTSRQTLGPSTTPEAQKSQYGTSSRDIVRQAESYLDSDDDLYASPTRLETVLSIANAGQKKSSVTPVKQYSSTDMSFGEPVLLLPPNQDQFSEPPTEDSKSDADMEEVSDNQSVPTRAMVMPTLSQGLPTDSHMVNVMQTEDLDEDDLEEVTPLVPHVSETTAQGPLDTTVRVFHSNPDNVDNASTIFEKARAKQIDAVPSPPSPIESESDQSDYAERWSRSRTPTGTEDVKEHVNEQYDDWDAAQEMDPHKEEGEYAQFLSQVRGKNLEEVRQEIDEEIKALNQQKKIAMRDSEDITQQMISQIMVRGIFLGAPRSQTPSADDASSLRHSIHHCTNGSGGSMRGAAESWTCRRDHHR